MPCSGHRHRRSHHGRARHRAVPRRRAPTRRPVRTRRRRSRRGSETCRGRHGPACGPQAHRPSSTWRARGADGTLTRGLDPRPRRRGSALIDPGSQRGKAEGEAQQEHRALRSRCRPQYGRTFHGDEPGTGTRTHRRERRPVTADPTERALLLLSLLQTHRFWLGRRIDHPARGERAHCSPRRRSAADARVPGRGHAGDGRGLPVRRGRAPAAVAGRRRRSRRHRRRPPRGRERVDRGDARTPRYGRSRSSTGAARSPPSACPRGACRRGVAR